MKIIADLHTHTIACGHAYSSLFEMIEGAKQKGIEILATTDHGPNMPGTSDLEYFRRLVLLPEVINDIRVLKGAEANIIGFDGTLDMPLDILSSLDLVLVGFHPFCGYQGQSEAENTRAMIGAITNPLVDLVVHPGNPMFPIDVTQVVEAAIKHDVILEINNSSFRGSRKGSWQNCYTIAGCALKAGALVSLGSDAHISVDVGRMDYGLKLVEQLNLDSELIINTSLERLRQFIQRKKLAKERFRTR